MPVSAEAFPRSRRLLKPDEYRRVFDRGRRSGDALFLVLGITNQTDFPRLGLAVSKKNCRRAVDRNRVKRMIRESFRHHQLSLGGLDVVVVARPGAATSDNQRCQSALQHHWRRILERCAK
ncbi:MAG: ribonuclease P protein component [Candidatus Thiodiazotropha sp.]